MICFNPLDKFYKSNIGAIPNNTKTIFRVKGNFDSVVFVFKKDVCGVPTVSQTLF